MADDAAMFELLKALAKRYRVKVGACNLHDSNVCTSVLNWRVAEASPPPDRFVRLAKFQYSGRRVTVRSSNEFVSMEMSASLAAGLVFSVNRPDQIQMTRPSELKIGRRLSVFVCSDFMSAAVAAILRVPEVKRATSALELRSAESLHVYQNGIRAYARPQSVQRLEALLRGLAALIECLPSAEGTGPDFQDLEDLPKGFHPLLPLIRRWAYTDDEEREEQLGRATVTDLRDLVKTLKPQFAAINRYLDGFDGAPMPLPAIALGALAECGTEAMLMLEEKKRVP